jgi:tRNA U34 2-thiouridine synthase MnmA/TrmU
MAQGVKVLGIVFKSCFFDEKQANKSAKEISLKLKTIDFSKKHLEIVKKPKYGYGKNMNPCIDCHLLMLKEAKLLMKKLKYDFVATGEVIGERPMSQNKNILKLLEKQSGLEGYLLRPLSAKLLEPTLIEKQRLVDRNKLLDISGRQRKKQNELVKNLKIKKFPQPSGGCMLTYAEFGKKLNDLFGKKPNCDQNDIELLKYGRHFWEGKTLFVVGRDEKDNKTIKKLKKKRDLLLEFKKSSGPTVLIRGSKHKSEIDKGKILLKKFSKAKGDGDIKQL